MKLIDAGNEMMTWSQQNPPPSVSGKMVVGSKRVQLAPSSFETSQL